MMVLGESLAKKCKHFKITYKSYKSLRDRHTTKQKQGFLVTKGMCVFFCDAFKGDHGWGRGVSVTVT